LRCARTACFRVLAASRPTLDRFYHALPSPGGCIVRGHCHLGASGRSSRTPASGFCCCGPSPRASPAETMIENPHHRNMCPRLGELLLVLSPLTSALPGAEGITLICASRTNQCRSDRLHPRSRSRLAPALAGRAWSGGRKKITVFDPVALAKRSAEAGTQRRQPAAPILELLELNRVRLAAVPRSAGAGGVLGTLAIGLAAGLARPAQPVSICAPQNRRTDHVLPAA